MISSGLLWFWVKCSETSIALWRNRRLRKTWEQNTRILQYTEKKPQTPKTKNRFYYKNTFIFSIVLFITTSLLCMHVHKWSPGCQIQWSIFSPYFTYLNQPHLKQMFTPSWNSLLLAYFLLIFFLPHWLLFFYLLY